MTVYHEKPRIVATLVIAVLLSLASIHCGGGDQPTGTVDLDIYGWGPNGQGDSSFTLNIPKFENATRVSVALTRPARNRVLKQKTANIVDRSLTLPGLNTGRGLRLEFAVFNENGDTVGYGATPRFDYDGSKQKESYPVMVTPVSAFAPVGYLAGSSTGSVTRSRFDARGLPDTSQQNFGLAGHRIIPFENGKKVLVVGGGKLKEAGQAGGLPQLSDVYSTIQVFDVGTGFFTDLSFYKNDKDPDQVTEYDRLNEGRAYHTVTPIAPKKFIVTGGLTVRAGQTRALNTVEVIDLTKPPGDRMSSLTDSVGNEQSLQRNRAFHTASYRSSDRSVIIAGGLGSGGKSEASKLVEKIDLVNATIDQVATLDSPRAYHEAAFVNNGGALWLVGGHDGSKALSSTVLLTQNDSGETQVQSGPNLKTGRFDFCMAELPTSVQRYVITGGYSSFDGEASDSMEIGWPDRFVSLSSSLSTERGGCQIEGLNRGEKFVVIGGRDSSGTHQMTADNLIFNGLQTDGSRFNVVESKPSSDSRFEATSALLSNGKVLITGGVRENNGLETLNSAEYFTPVRPLTSQ